MSQRNFSIDASFTFLSPVSFEAFSPRLVFLPQATFRLAVQNICTFFIVLLPLPVILSAQSICFK